MRGAWTRSAARLAILLGLACTAPSIPAQEPPADDPGASPDAQAVEFFEKEVRPLLVERCQGCHGPDKAKNELRLDSRASALAGGITGPAIVPGSPEESLLIDAVNYGDLYHMPPKSKLPPEQIQTLTRWVQMGAPWPGSSAAVAASSSGGPDFAAILQERKAKHWSFQPLADPEPPAVGDESWPLRPIDRFLLARLEAEGLKPAPEADRRTLIRRLSFDLVGLPPTPEEVEAFESDPQPDAYERLVERLLASPHYGERWGRHWLDLVRYAETAGHEFDYNIPNAYRYRDYVVRAFNADLPYDQFVREHLAGDLIPEPRRHPTEGLNESILGTGFFFLGEGTHSPVDVRDEQVRRVDNQIDVLGKAFLGLTIACARCHDHKFDPIATRDYYALFGYLSSSRFQQAFLDPPERNGSKIAEIKTLKEQISPALNEVSRPVERQIAGCLLAASRVAKDSTALSTEAAAAGLDPQLVDRWRTTLLDGSNGLPEPLLACWNSLLGRSAASASPSEDADAALVFETFDRDSYGGWFVSGDAFGAGPSGSGAWRLGSAGPEPVAAGWAHSGLISDRLQGVLRSRSFTIEHPYIQYRAAGIQGRVNLVVDGFEKIRDPIYGRLAFSVETEGNPRWFTQDVSMWVGHTAYIELADGAVVDFNGSQTAIVPGHGFLAVDQIRFADEPALPSEPLALDGSSPESLASDLARKLAGAFDGWRTGQGNGEAVDAFGWLVRRGLISLSQPDEDWVDRYRAIEATLEAPTLGLAIADGNGIDEHVMIRGNYRSPGEVAPRGFLTALVEGDQPPAPEDGSGRLALANRLLDPSNPLPARVLVNRVWKHHFGEGIVRSVDDFGAMGQEPSHPDLLDYLARRFIAEGWSIKSLHREIVLSRAYRMRSVGDPAADRVDPSNRLLHRQNVLRLEAEAIRDAMLSLSGRLDESLGGPGVLPHLTPFMEGRGRPGDSGPLDGDGRRSLYLNLRRNFLPPLLLAFDFPLPTSTFGRRNVSNVPAQALTLLNDPFVLEQARLWAERAMAEPGLEPKKRLDRLYLAAFSRPPTDAETDAALAYLRARSAEASDAVEPWADLCHVLLNVKEFLFIN